MKISLLHLTLSSQVNVALAAMYLVAQRLPIQSQCRIEINNVHVTDSFRATTKLRQVSLLCMSFWKFELMSTNQYTIDGECLDICN